MSPSPQERKYVVIGKGKTGSAVLQTLGSSRLAGVFSRTSPIQDSDLATLKNASAAIVFVPAEGLRAVLPALLEAKIPTVCGTTGLVWDSGLREELLEKNIPWIVGSNFSPGMNLFFLIAKLIDQNRAFLGSPDLKIRELHHTQKKDSPSGTALKLNQFLGGGNVIQSERVGDHPGLHELKVHCPHESLTIVHEAQDRRLFAQGAVYAAEKLLPNLAPGLHEFETLLQQSLIHQLKEAP